MVSEILPADGPAGEADGVGPPLAHLQPLQRDDHGGECDPGLQVCRPVCRGVRETRGQERQVLLCSHFRRTVGQLFKKHVTE